MARRRPKVPSVFKRAPPHPLRRKEPATFITLFADHAVRKLVNVVDGQPFRWCSLHKPERLRVDIARGDMLYAMHLDANAKLCTIAKMRVAYRGPLYEWNGLHADAPAERIENREDYTEVVVGERGMGTPMHFARPLPIDVVRALHFQARWPIPFAVDDEGRFTDEEQILRLRLAMVTKESADELETLNWI